MIINNPQPHNYKESYFHCEMCNHCEKDFISLNATQQFSKADNLLEWVWQCKQCFQSYSMPTAPQIKLPFKQFKV